MVAGRFNLSPAHCPTEPTHHHPRATNTTLLHQTISISIQRCRSNRSFPLPKSLASAPPHSNHTTRTLELVESKTTTHKNHRLHQGKSTASSASSAAPPSCPPHPVSTTTTATLRGDQAPPLAPGGRARCINRGATLPHRHRADSGAQKCHGLQARPQ